MTIRFIIPLIISLIVQPIFAKTYPMQEFEMVIVESLPEGLDLGMSLSQITDKKSKSRIGATKGKLYQIMTERVLTVLESQSKQGDYNLLDLAKNTPVEEIVNDVMLLEGKNEGDVSPADFLVVILPKLPKSKMTDGPFNYAPLYSANKASVINSKASGFDPSLGYEENLNKRIQDALELAYYRNYMLLELNEAFYVGSLLRIHIEGKKSWVKFQMLGGLPTGISQPFVQEEKELRISEFRSPKAPSLEELRSKQFPGAIITLDYAPNGEQKLNAKIQFGSLGEISDSQWDLTDKPAPYEDSYLYKWFGVQLASYAYQYNVPNLFGDPVALLGAGATQDIFGAEFSFGDDYFAKHYNIHLNVHEVDINLDKLEITDMRVTVDLLKKEGHEFLWSLVPSLPTIEQPDGATAKIKDAGNAELAKVKTKVEPLLNSGVGEMLRDQATQEQLLGVITNLLQRQAGGEQ